MKRVLLFGMILFCTYQAKGFFEVICTRPANSMEIIGERSPSAEERVKYYKAISKMMDGAYKKARLRDASLPPLLNQSSLKQRSAIKGCELYVKSVTKESLLFNEHIHYSLAVTNCEGVGEDNIEKVTQLEITRTKERVSIGDLVQKNALPIAGSIMLVAGMIAYNIFSSK